MLLRPAEDSCPLFCSRSPPPASLPSRGDTRGSARSSDGTGIRNRPRRLGRAARLPGVRAHQARALLMTAAGWIQIALFCAAVFALTKPLGAYMFRVFEGDPLLPRVERALFKLCGVNPKGQTWGTYAFSLLLFSLLGMLVTYFMQRLQQVLPLNPQHLGAVEPMLAFNTAASFTTNTNWQSYTPETTVSYLTQMAGLAWHNFTSAAAGIAIALAVARGLTRKGGAAGGKTIGNF